MPITDEELETLGIDPPDQDAQSIIQKLQGQALDNPSLGKRLRKCVMSRQYELDLLVKYPYDGYWFYTQNHLDRISGFNEKYYACVDSVEKTCEEKGLPEASLEKMKRKCYDSYEFVRDLAKNSKREHSQWVKRPRLIGMIRDKFNACIRTIDEEHKE
jgi:hypothetical protein